MKIQVKEGKSEEKNNKGIEVEVVEKVSTGIENNKKVEVNNRGDGKIEMLFVEVRRFARKI